jgi:hypothetical protein
MSAEAFIRGAHPAPLRFAARDTYCVTTTGYAYGELFMDEVRIARTHLTFWTNTTTG